MMSITEQLLLWYKGAKRSLPWRDTKDPYLIWLSEIILQQTRVDQGMGYYLRFAKAYPDVKSLADASETEVLKLWQGLGYYSRARNLHFTARQISQDLHGEFPDEYSEIIKLKGVGPYTAAAIASIAFGEAKAVVDGNVKRLMSRIYGLKSTGEALHREAELKMKLLIDHNNPGDFNQAVMEFGALHCSPKNPDCNKCVLKENCVAFKTGRVEELPLKLPARKAIARYFSYFVLFDRENSKLVVKQRSEGDIWKNLYDFPLIESMAEESLQALQQKTEIKNWFDHSHEWRYEERTYKHQLTHRTIFARFYLAEIHELNELKMQKGWEPVSFAELKKLPVSRLIDRFMKDHPEIFSE
jgi:A/G-specific adenine glycosylase